MGILAVFNVVIYFKASIDKCSNSAFKAGDSNSLFPNFSSILIGMLFRLDSRWISIELFVTISFSLCAAFQ